MVESADFHALFTQLQTRYPGSGLVSELLQIQADQYVVRVSIQMGAMTLATGLAAATSVEQAEDQARLRALRLVGIVPLGFVGSSAISLAPYLPIAVALPPDSIATGPSPESIAAVAPTSVLPESVMPASVSKLPTSPIASESLEQEVLIPDSLPSLPESFVEEEEDPKLAAVSAKTPKPKPSRNSTGKKTTDLNLEPLPEPEPLDQESFDQEPDFSSLEPIDLSELIALTDVEMERVGWSKKRGQTHLKQVYDRQTRAELDEEQLLEFLHYLRALPSSS